MSLTSDTDSNLSMNIDRIHYISFLYFNSDITDDHIYSAFHLNSDMKSTHKLNFDFHIACF